MKVATKSTVMIRLRAEPQTLKMRPIASRIPSGTESVMPTNVSTTVSGSPPHMSVEMDESPKTPPSIRTKKAMRVAAQPSAMMRAPCGSRGQGAP